MRRVPRCVRRIPGLFDRADTRLPRPQLRLSFGDLVADPWREIASHERGRPSRAARSSTPVTAPSDEATLTARQLEDLHEAFVTADATRLRKQEDQVGSSENTKENQMVAVLAK